MRTDQLVDHDQLAAMPEALHRVPGMQGAILVIARDGMIIKRQLRFSYLFVVLQNCRERLSMIPGELYSYSLVFALQIVPADHEQVGKHFERIAHQADPAALAMLDHLHRHRLDGIFAFTSDEEHFHIETKSANRQAAEDFPCRLRLEAFEATLCIRQTLE